MALLLSSFGSESLKKTQTEEIEVNKLQEAIERISRFVLYIRSHVVLFVRGRIKKEVYAAYDFDPTATQQDLTTKNYYSDVHIPQLANGRIGEDPIEHLLQGDK